MLKNMRRNLTKKMTRKTHEKVYRKSTKPPTIIDRFIDLRKSFSEAHPEGMTEEDKCRLWAEAGGANSKGQIYGQGSLKKVQDFRNPGTLSTQAMALNVDRNQLGELQKSIEEDLRRSITEEV